MKDEKLITRSFVKSI